MADEYSKAASGTCKYCGDPIDDGVPEYPGLCWGCIDEIDDKAHGTLTPDEQMALLAKIDKESGEDRP